MKDEDKIVKTNGYKEKTSIDTKDRDRIFVSMGINRFGERLKEAMGGMSNNELARRSGMSETTIRKYLKGDIYPGIDSAALVAHACDVSLIWLVSGIEQKAEVGKGESSEEKIDVILQMLTENQRDTLINAILEHGITGIQTALSGISTASYFLQLPENEREQLMRLHSEIKKGAFEDSQEHDVTSNRVKMTVREKTKAARDTAQA